MWCVEGQGFSDRNGVFRDETGAIPGAKPHELAGSSLGILRQRIGEGFRVELGPVDRREQVAFSIEQTRIVACIDPQHLRQGNVSGAKRIAPVQLALGHGTAARILQHNILDEVAHAIVGQPLLDRSDNRRRFGPVREHIGFIEIGNARADSVRLA